MLNHIVLMGRLVADPEVRRTQSGKQVTSFRIACDRGRKDTSGQSQADFFDVTVLGSDFLDSTLVGSSRWESILTVFLCMSFGATIGVTSEIMPLSWNCIKSAMTPVNESYRSALAFIMHLWTMALSAVGTCSPLGRTRSGSGALICICKSPMGESHSYGRRLQIITYMRMPYA